MKRSKKSKKISFSDDSIEILDKNKQSSIDSKKQLLETLKKLTDALDEKIPGLNKKNLKKMANSVSKKLRKYISNIDFS